MHKIGKLYVNYCIQSCESLSTISSSTAAVVLSSDCLHGVPVQTELCTQRPCCQEHPGGMNDKTCKVIACCNVHKIITHPRHVYLAHFYCCPFYRNQTSTRGITFVIFQISRHAKICNLHAEKQMIDLVRCSSYLACLVIIHQDVPGSKVSVYKALLGQVLHT